MYAPVLEHHCTCRYPNAIGPSADTMLNIDRDTLLWFFGGFFYLFYFQAIFAEQISLFQKGDGSRNKKSDDTHTELNSANIAWKFSFSFYKIRVSVSFNSFGRDRLTHICVVHLTIIGSDNDLLPDQSQAILWNNAGILLIGPLGRNFSET